MTKNVTLRVEEKLLREARHLAVDEGLSISAFMVRAMEEKVSGSSTCLRMRERALRLLDQPQRLKGAILTREAVHER